MPGWRDRRRSMHRMPMKNRQAWIAATAVVILALAFLLVFKRSAAWRSPKTATISDETSAALILAYPLRQGGWARIRRPILSLPKTSEERTRKIVEELTCVDASAEVFAPLPESFPLRSVYVDGSQLYLDIAHEGLQELSGGTEEELIVLESLKQSLAWNLPDVEKFQILIDGVPRRTLGAVGEDAGHINILGPIRLKR